jgi:hypothetical protein
MMTDYAKRIGMGVLYLAQLALQATSPKQSTRRDRLYLVAADETIFSAATPAA